MLHVRVYLNRQKGATWWAEGDSGFVGGADRLSDLIEKIHEWAGCEGVSDGLAVRLVDDPPEAPTRQPVLDHRPGRHGSAGAHDVLSVGPVFIPV